MTRLYDTNRITQGSPERLAKHNLFETPRFFADVYVLAPGQAQAPHVHAGEDKCYHVLSGRGIVTSASERLAVMPGHIVHCPAGEPHGVENDGDEDLRVLVFMAPHPRADRIRDAR